MTDNTLHPLIRDHRVFVSCGVWDCLSAKIAARAGFKTVVVSGYAVSASYLGEPDFGLLTMTDVLGVAQRIIRATDVSVIVDGDTGFGGALNVQYFVRELVRMGARGVILEDQTWPKRCGHMRGKSVVPMEEHVMKLRAAREAADGAPFLITARTDARGPLGLAEAIRRGHAYRDAGADLLFVEAPQSKAEMQTIVKELGGALVLNNIEGGVTPILGLDEVTELGYVSVGFVLTGLFAAAQAMQKTFSHILEHGDSRGLEGELMGFDEFTGLLGLDEKYALDERFKCD
jgi:methylisocitrate lyase